MFNFSKFRKNESGQIGVIFALSALPLMALTSAGLDYSQFTKERNRISSALDAAVLAAANNNAISDSDKDEYARTHFEANYDGDMILSLSPSITSDRVRLVAEGVFELTFGNIAGIDDLNLVEASAASLKQENTICVLSLSEDADVGVSYERNLEFIGNGCSVHSNSTSPTAIWSRQSSKTPKAASFCAVGGIRGKIFPHAKGECSPVDDPYVAVPAADIETCKSEFLYESTGPLPGQQNGQNDPQDPNEQEAQNDQNIPSDPITQLENQLDQLNAALADLENQIAQNTDNNLRNVLNNSRNDLINGRNSIENSLRNLRNQQAQQDLNDQQNAANNEFDQNAVVLATDRFPGNPDISGFSEVSLDALIARLQSGVGTEFHHGLFVGTELGAVNEQRQTIEILLNMTGDDLFAFLQAFDEFPGPNQGQQLGCALNACGLANPPNFGPNLGDIPLKNLVTSVFGVAFGDAFEPNEGGAGVPDVVTNGTVELINGQLFSRNNLDGALVPVSSNLTGGNIVLTPGTYCGGLTVDGLKVRFTPGDYVFKDGPLTFLNNSEAEADKVTFGFTGEGATLNIESGSTLDIRAAITGPRAGLAFMQMIDPSLPGNREKLSGINRISSGGSVAMSGTAYFREQELQFSGANTRLGSNSPAVGLIADKIAFRGEDGAKIEIAVDHVKAGVPPIQPQADDGVRLVE